MDDKRPELLAPAGSYAIMEQAFQAGADAVYLGGQRFGARAYADNLTEEELLRGIRYARFHHKRLYLTVNTLLKNEEIDRLCVFLKAPYEEGLDAVIVQDLGVAKLIREQFPDLELHISTQLSITSSYGAGLLKDLGVKRLIPARELSLEELRRLKQETGMEIEVFVHGALCYSFSGQCLLSSMIGGRSGNRGRCAQPCRQRYSLEKRAEGYYLSMKDLCGLASIPALIEAGMDSFKIEGRMKKPEYVIAAVDTYRRAMDAFMQGKYDAFAVKKEQERLADIYNRGMFTEGYFYQRNGRSMLSVERSNHNGILLGEITFVSGPRLGLYLQQELHKGDVLEIRTAAGTRIELTSGQVGKAGETVFLNGKQMKRIQTGDKVYRTKNQWLCEHLISENENHILKEKIHIFVRIRKEKSVMIKAKCGNLSATVVGKPATAAMTQPLSREMVIEKLNRLGSFPFVIDSLELDMDEDCFYPMKAFNLLRRQVLEELLDSYQNQGRRTSPDLDKRSYFNQKQTKAPQPEKEHSPLLAVSVSTWEQFEAILDISEVDRIDIELEAECFCVTRTKQALERIHETGKQGYFSLPRLFRMDMEQPLMEYMSLAADGYVVRTFDQLGWIRDLKPTANLVLDYSVYAYNREAAACYGNWCKGGLSLTLPVEFSGNELRELAASGNGICWEWIVYGSQPVMISAQCVRKTVEGCRKNAQSLTLENGFQDNFRVQTVCRYCYNVIYRNTPVNLLLYKAEQKNRNLKVYRYQLTTETSEDIKRLFLTKGYQTGEEGRYRKGME